MIKKQRRNNEETNKQTFNETKIEMDREIDGEKRRKREGEAENKEKKMKREKSMKIIEDGVKYHRFFYISIIITSAL